MSGLVPRSWTRCALVLLTTLGTLASASHVRAWSCMRIDCPAYCEAPTYYVGGLSASLETIASGTTVAEVTRAMDDWSRVSCTDLDPAYGGRTTARAIEGDGLDVIEFVTDEWELDANVIGATTQSYVGRCIVESDVQMNARNYVFVRNPTFESEINAYSALLHEGGHVYGLGHSGVSTSVMYFRYGRGVLEIREDDAQGLCTLYPGDGTQDCTVNGCPSGQTCEGGTCVDAPPPSCTTDFDCISIFRCNLGTGLCEPRPNTGAALGAACATDAECQSGLCLPTASGSVCSQTCDALDPRSCPSSFYCSGQAVSDCAIGVCLAGVGGSGAFGSPCTAATECASLFCGDGVCTVPCERGVSTACPVGFACHPSEFGACGTCGDPTPTGGPCEDSGECEGGLCFDPDLDGAGFCTSECVTDAACPDGYACATLGDRRVCRPAGELRGGGTCHLAADPRERVPSAALVFAGLLVGVTLGHRRTTKRR